MNDTNEEVKGTIHSRRCHGKHLSFASVLENNGSVVEVAFRRSIFQGDPGSFPVKASMLPYGAVVTIIVKAMNPDAPPCVISWSLLEEDPRSRALCVASNSDGGISCEEYFRARGALYLKLHGDRVRTLAEAGRGNKQEKSLKVTRAQHMDEHGNSNTKGKRSEVFATWLAETLFSLGGQTSWKVLDVAGGKGQLSIELSKHGIASTVVDPLIRGKRSRKRLEQSRDNLTCGRHEGLPCFLPGRFEEDEYSIQLAEKYDCLVGLHADECTESVLNVALDQEKLVAIVPCCVFPDLFPLRTLNDGRIVRTYEDFLMFLLEKDPRLRQASLPFEGKNQVIYLAPEGYR